MISTDAAWITADAPQPIERASEHNMVVSITRHRRSITDTTHTYQVPLSIFKEVRHSDQSLLKRLQAILRNRLDTDKDGHPIVWRMSDTSQFAFVNSKNSFDAAILDHKSANKKVIQLFVVRNDNIHYLPGLDFSN
ncbi:hypothetical protein KCU98_g15392, partial [Aureobasidium melanogenum]